MKYMGSKNKYSKYILPIILKNRKPNQYYIEPFVGGCNLIDKVAGPRIANDINPYLIALFKNLQNGWIPPDNLSKKEYDSIRLNKKLYPPHLVGFVGFGCSYSGKWFGGFARSYNKNGPRNHCLESKNACIKQVVRIQSVEFFNLSYDELVIPSQSVVYCDPPYEGTTSYSNKFDHYKFWEWIRTISKNNEVYVSEYNAPSDFECIWQKETNNSLTRNTGAKKGVEKLFIKKGLLS